VARERRISVGDADFWCRLEEDGRFWVLQGRGGQWEYHACFAPDEPAVAERIYVPCADKQEAARVLEGVRREMGGGEPCGACA
jgi:hypothetical protein